MEQLGEYSVRQVVEELLNQGHKASGNLIESVQAEFTRRMKVFEIAISYLKYGVYLEKGIKAREYKRGPSREEIEGLLNWLRYKRLVAQIDNAARSFAFAIAYAHRRDGFPTPNARNFSPNGRTTRFQSIAINNIANEADRLLGEAITEAMNLVIENIVNDTVSQISKAA
jgi:hypothetical protein